ncbi:hypothetical protein F4810DRAFT_706267 [Camillea tinctor]|nr:hypothetical protein F4810DRAFT_706267 [Camillea tinctor]
MALETITSWHSLKESPSHGDDVASLGLMLPLSRRDRLHQLLLMDARDKYFVLANSLRAQGLSTSHLQTPSTNRRHEHASLDIASLMQLWTGQAGFGNRTASSEALVGII